MNLRKISSFEAVGRWNESVQRLKCSIEPTIIQNFYTSQRGRIQSSRKQEESIFEQSSRGDEGFQGFGHAQDLNQRN